MELKLICIAFDMFMVLCYAILGLMFIKSKGKGSNYIAGYNMKSQEDRKNYDEEKICRYFGKTIMSWALFFLIGAVVDWFIPIAGLSGASLFFMIGLLYHVFHTKDKLFDEKFRV